MRDYYKKLFQYDYWANKRVINSIIAASYDKKINELFSHIIAAETIWLNRLTYITVEYPDSWVVFPVNRFSELSYNINRKWNQYLDASIDYENILVYKTSKGEEYKNKISDIIIHVINHSTYHRGQIALMIRRSGNIPASTDYINFTKE